MKADKKKLAVWKFASCDGCQLSLLDCEDELLAIADAIIIAYFPEATKAVVEGPYDISLIEGSVTTPSDAMQLLRIRKNSELVISIGACATAGGIQALRNYTRVAGYVKQVYAHPEYIKTLETSTPISDHIKVDFELRGCPINKYQLLEVLTSYLIGKRPNTPTHSICNECKKAGQVCVMVARSTPCLGPVTQAGCQALCPGYYRGCFGCYGPKENPNTASLAAHFSNAGLANEEIMRLFRNFNSGAEAFENESRHYE